MHQGNNKGIHATNLDSDRLRQLAVDLAGSHTISNKRIADTIRKKYPLLERIEQLEELLQAAYQRVTRLGDSKITQSYATEWFLDNYYLVDDAFIQIREDLPPKYYQKLPLLCNSDHQSHPRVLNLAWVLLSKVDFNPNSDQITRFVNAYQYEKHLMISEIWAIPIMLRIGILEALSQVISGIVDVTLPQFGPEVDDIVGESGRRNLVANCIQGLRTLKNLEWKEFFENVSLVERKLNEDPSGVYPNMTFNTRDQYRKVIEQLAQDSGIEEAKIAILAVELSRDFSEHNPSAEDPADLVQTHVGYYLVGRGLSQLIKTDDFTRSGYTPSQVSRLRNWLSDHSLSLYLGIIFLIIIILETLLVLYLNFLDASNIQTIIATIVAFIPASVVAVGLVNALAPYVVPPRKPLPRMNFSEQDGGIPESCRTLVVIPALLSDSDQIETLLRQIELYYLANHDVQTFFALLTDFPDADQQHMLEDEDLLDHISSGIRKLNDLYKRSEGNNFFLIHRDRKWNPVMKTWMGWERKRGKLIQLNSLIINGDGDCFSVIIGDVNILRKVRFVVTLDEDTLLPKNTVRELAGTLAHPFNRPQFDSQSGRITAGYTFLQPRLEVKPESVRKTWFSRIFVGEGGIDLYSQVVSDVYQDLFAEGSYMGKGIYDVNSFMKSLEGRIPENAVLSHDLLEGIYGRAGLVTDIVLYEEFPITYLEYIQRLHRWVRGDWQLLPWLFPVIGNLPEDARSNPLSPLGIWKIIDNLRRSLAFPATLAFLLLSWLWLPGAVSLWTLLVLAILAIPLFTVMLPHVWQGLRSRALRNLGRSMKFDFLRWLLNIVFLPYQSLVMLDAIAKTIIRLLITQKNLLQWTTASQTRQLLSNGTGARFIWERMWLMVVFVVSLILLVGFLDPKKLLSIVPILVLWLLSPQIAHWINQSPDTLLYKKKEEKASFQQEQELRKLARQTWLFFERFTGPEDHWMPPDHYQETPRGTVAHRTSPTNIGLGLLSIMAAYDLGYIGAPELSVRAQNMLYTLDTMEKYNGHLLNWYETHSLKPLPPRYVSTVDSGNFAGCLLAFKEGLIEIMGEPVIRSKDWQGLLDALALLEDSMVFSGINSQIESHLDIIDQIRIRISAVREEPDKWFRELNFILKHHWVELNEQIMSLLASEGLELESEIIAEMRIWLQRVHQQLMALLRTINDLLPWLTVSDQFPAFFARNQVPPILLDQWDSLTELFTVSLSLLDIKYISKEIHNWLSPIHRKLEEGTFDRILLDETVQVSDFQEWCSQFSDLVESSSQKAGLLLSGFQEMIEKTEVLFAGINFQFLYNHRRNLFRIGYNVDSGKFDQNHYDLLASEARLASLIAIATGDVPQKHWLYLGRPLTRTEHGDALISWSGSMFEFLMPHLLIRLYPNTMMDLTLQAIVEKQIDYCHSNGVPWGISESGFYHFDANMNYQYRAFGVPGLGLKRGLDVDLVIAPYASILALPVRPKAVLENMAWLLDLGMKGLYGFYEAMDFTDSRIPLAKDFAPIHSYMAHHQGMIMLSLTNFLENDSMIRRFHSDPRIENFELLLHEQAPANPRLKFVEEHEITRIQRPSSRMVETSWEPITNLGFPAVHFLSNGILGSLITSNGGGFIQYLPTKARQAEPIMITRWRPDTTLDCWGIWVYLEDRENNYFWSSGIQPTGTIPETHNVEYYPHQVVFSRRDKEITTQTSITISSEDNVEIRKIVLVNHQDRNRSLRITSYGEVVVSDNNSDRRHPAFNKLFLQSEFIPEINAIISYNRPRSNDEEVTYVIHMLTIRNSSVPYEGVSTLQFECDRANFLGRWNSIQKPVVIGGVNGNQQKTRLSNTGGYTLDPIMALSFDVELAPRETQEMAFITFVTTSRQKAIELANHYLLWARVERTFRKSAAANRRELEKLDIKIEQLSMMQQLLSLLYYPHHSLRESAVTLAANQAGQSALWAYAISGDYPVLLARVGQSTQFFREDIILLGNLVKAHNYWRKRGILIDLVILNQIEESYDQDLQGEISQVITNLESDRWINKRGGIFLLNKNRMKAEETILLETVARAIFDGNKGTFEDQVKAIPPMGAGLPRFMVIEEPFSQPLSDQNMVACHGPSSDTLLFDNGMGGFSADGKEYIIHLAPGNYTPLPWSNVIANQEFGFIISTAGMGCTWAVNSGENRLTPWWNDPLSEPPSEIIYIRNEETGEFWSPTPLPVRSNAAFCIRHGAGYSIFEHKSHGLEHKLRIFIDPKDPVKIVSLKVENVFNRRQLLTITYYADWVLGTDRGSMSPFIISEFNPGVQALLVHNHYNQEFKEREAFLTTTSDIHEFTADRAEFLGMNGSYSNPEALNRVGLSGTVTPGSDPCAAIRIFLLVEPGETGEVFFVLGQGKDHQDTLELISKYQNINQIECSWQNIRSTWRKLFDTLQVQTPDPAMNLMMNQWLVYQTLSCRFWGRSAMYQSSGAYGFRDQLQDVMALVYAAPDLTREHILRAARHQFEEGDVLHWWHPPSGRGIRTRCSDNLLWLPYVTAYYVNHTGDDAILWEIVPFLSAEPLGEEELERYDHYKIAGEEGTLFQHCLLALDRGITHGKQGLPLIGSHDWNDGMNRVGIQGEGESVWLGWFLFRTLLDFTEIIKNHGDDYFQTENIDGKSLIEHYQKTMEALRQSLEEHAWDGKWYRRAFFDDGTPLGSAQNEECKIDSIAQSWAVLSKAGDPDRLNRAMLSLEKLLVDRDAALITLFTPPFDKTSLDPGYIKGYPPGIRENGGQYTHASLWAIWAYISLGQIELAYDLYRMINPVFHGDSLEKILRYQVEPYVVAADVYSIEPHKGKGGWTWYTGSAGWMYQVGLEGILGLKRTGKILQIDPKIPSAWDKFFIDYRYEDTLFRIHVDNVNHVNQGVVRINMDGEDLPDKVIRLENDARTHQVKVYMGE